MTVETKRIILKVLDDLDELVCGLSDDDIDKIDYALDERDVIQVIYDLYDAVKRVNAQGMPNGIKTQEEDNGV